MFKKFTYLILVVVLATSVFASYRYEIYDYSGYHLREKVNYSLFNAALFSGGNMTLTGNVTAAKFYYTNGTEVTGGGGSSYTNGTGLILTGDTFSVSLPYFQNLFMEITAYNYLSNFTDDILWTSDFNSTFSSLDSDTTYDNGTGLDLATTTFSVTDSFKLPQGCSENKIPVWNGSIWTCGTDNAGAGAYDLDITNGSSATAINDTETLVLAGGTGIYISHAYETFTITSTVSEPDLTVYINTTELDNNSIIRDLIGYINVTELDNSSVIRSLIGYINTTELDNASIVRSLISYINSTQLDNSSIIRSLEGYINQSQMIGYVNETQLDNSSIIRNLINYINDTQLDNSSIIRSLDGYINSTEFDNASVIRSLDGYVNETQLDNTSIIRDLTNYVNTTQLDNTSIIRTLLGYWNDIANWTSSATYTTITGLWDAGCTGNQTMSIDGNCYDMVDDTDTQLSGDDVIGMVGNYSADNDTLTHDTELDDYGFWNETNYDLNSSIDNRTANITSSVSDNSTFGVLRGFTADTYNGNFSNSTDIGYNRADMICDAEYSGSHFCLCVEIMKANINGSSNPDSVNEAWCANGPPGYTAAANDCNGWNAVAGGNIGPKWKWSVNDGDGAGQLTPCSSTIKISCCGGTS